MTENTGRKPMDYFASYMGIYFVAGFVSYLFYGIGGRAVVFDSISNEFLKMVIYVLSTTLAAPSRASFYFRAIHRGSPDLKDLYTIFTEKSTQRNMLGVLATGLAITGALNLVSSAVEDIPVVSLVVTLAVMAVGMLLKPVWYMFVANPYYAVKAYYTNAMKYMKGHLMKYIGIVALYAVGMVGSFMFLLLLGTVGAVLSVMAVVFFMVLMDIRLALFMKDIIPAEWYTGQAE